MVEFLEQYSVKKKLFIITTKKILYVKKLLKSQNIPLLDQNLYTATHKNSKRDIILSLLKQYEIPPEHFSFVDDQIDTLIKVKDTGINCILAEWGYNDSNQINLAKEKNIEIVNLTEFRNKFM